MAEDLDEARAAVALKVERLKMEAINYGGGGGSYEHLGRTTEETLALADAYARAAVEEALFNGESGLEVEHSGECGLPGFPCERCHYDAVCARLGGEKGAG